MTHNAAELEGEILQDLILNPAGFQGLEMRTGDVLRIIDVEGKQVAGVAFVYLHRKDEKLSAPNSLGLNRKAYPSLGYKFYSDEAKLMMTMTADTCGTHSIIAGACSSFMNELRYGDKHAHNCRDNFASALKSWGLGWKDIPYPLNVFMNVPVKSDGAYEIEFPLSKAGDYVDLTAEMDLLVAVSNCPQVRNKVNAHALKPIRLVQHRPK
ncbi:MAG: urea carboxylase-associated family protein [Beijerinckiaceae bacterium]|nr:urea carboxylase-associated family protein [Beijerinckiaceae bacterium]